MHLLLTALFPKQIIFEKMGSWYEQIQKIYTTQSYFRTSLTFSGQMVHEKKSYYKCQQIFNDSNYLLLQSTWLFILTILNPLYPRICQVWLKLANSVTEKKIKNLMYKLYRRMDRLWHPIKSDHKSSLEVWQFRWAKYITVTVTYSTVTKRCKK